MAKFIDLTGMRFGRLSVLRRGAGKASRDGYKNAMWECKCDCGTVKYIAGPNLRRGDTVSCGCFHRERVIASKRLHGMSYTPEHRTWTRIIQKCHNPTDRDYKNYGGRGLTVCDRWRNDFLSFFVDMGKRPGREYSIERIDNNSGYSPENCKWATVYEQSRNRRDTRIIEYNGQRLCILDWAKKIGLDRSTIYGKMAQGLTPEQTIAFYMERPIKEPKMSIQEEAKKLGVTKQAIYKLMKNGLSAKDAISQIKARQKRSAELRMTLG